MNRRIVQVAVLTFLLMTRVSPGFSQTSSELKNFLSQKMGQSQDQIVAIEHGQPFAKEIEPRSPAEIFVVGVIYINALPESYVRFFGDFNRLRHIPFPEYMAVSEFSGSPRLSDLQGFGFGSDDVKALRDCTSEKCAIQIPSSANMDELRKSVNWSAPNVDEEVNQLLQKLALSRMQEYQKEGNRIFGAVYNDRGQRVNVADQFKHMIEYYQILVQDLPDFYHYILDYPNAKLANVEDTFRWERVDFGLKPTLRIVHILTMHGEKPDQPAYVIAEKQLYASHYFETALDITFLIRGSDDPKEPGFYLVKAIGCEQAMLTGLTGAATRRIAVDRSVSDLKKSLAYVKDALEHQR